MPSKAANVGGKKGGKRRDDDDDQDRDLSVQEQMKQLVKKAAGLDDEDEARSRKKGEKHQEPNGKASSKSRKNGDDDEENEEQELVKGSRKKGGKHQDDTDEEDGKTKNSRGSKKPMRDEEDEEELRPKNKKGNKKSTLNSDDEDELEHSKSKRGTGKSQTLSDDEDEDDRHQKGKKASKKNTVDDEEEQEIRGGKTKSKSKKKGLEDEAEDVPKTKAKKKGDESTDDNRVLLKKEADDDDEDDQPSEGLSKTALKKLKREAKKNKGTTTVAESSGAKKQSSKADAEEEEDEDWENVNEDHAILSDGEEADYAAEKQVIEQFQSLGLGDGDGEEDPHSRRAEKKKKKKQEEKKKRVKAAHGIVEDLDVPPTPPPQEAPDDDISHDEDVLMGGDDEGQEETAHAQKKTPQAEEEKHADEEDDDNEHEASGEGAVIVASKKKKLSNKEKRRLREELARQEDEATAAAMAKPPDNSVFAVSATSVDIDSESWKNARDIIIPAFSVTAKGKTLFKDAELRISQGRRYGLIGPNGKGKSVLLRAIASREIPIPPGIDCLYVEQEVVAGDELAVNVVLSADVRRTYLLKREQELMTLVDDPNVEITDEMHEELKSVSDELRITKADSMEAKALNLLHGLGFSDEMCRMPTKHLSGGWRMRVSIAKGLFLEPTLLLLDEPTNHLDLEAVIFLESVLSKWEKTLVVVSHDQDFLDEVCQEIIHLDAQKLWYYKGNYTAFEDLFKVQMEQRKKDYEKQVKQMREEKKSKNRLTAKERENEMKRKQREDSKTDKARKNEELAIAAAGKNRGVKNAENTAAIDRPKDYVVRFSFPPPDELTPPIIQVRDVHFRYNDQAPWLFHNLNFGIDMSSRICICGPNGAGKSTLIGLLTQSLSPTEGEILVNRNLRVASYKQHFVDALPLGKTPIEYLHAKHNEPEQDIRGMLGRYGLSGDAHTIKMASLSGGQKARVVFADMSYQNPHIIIADEPSNNLDMQSIRALGEAINEFEGGVILVSHDTRLITETNMILWVVERQTVLEQTGGIEEYREEILEKIAKREAEAARVLEEKQAKKLAEREAKLKELEDRRRKKLADTKT